LDKFKPFLSIFVGRLRQRGFIIISLVDN